MDSFVDLVLKAGAGALLAAVASWAIGRVNNAMTITLSGKRCAAKGEDDVVALTVRLKKVPPTRVRLDACKATAKIDGETDDTLGAALTDSFRSDIVVGKGVGVTLVPGDEVQYQAMCRVPAGKALHVKLKVMTTQLLFDSVAVSRPIWSSSVAVLPESE